MRSLTGCALVLWVAGASACSGENDAANVAADDSAAILDDDQLAMVLMAANQGELSESQSAQPRLTNDEVRQYSAQMILGHSAALEREHDLLASASLTPSPSDASERLLGSVDSDLQLLAGASSGPAFDLTYMCAQIRAHAATIGFIATQAGGTFDAQLAAEASTVQSDALTHRALARLIVASLAGGDADVASTCAPWSRP